jgi:hypothetical protein
MYRHPAAISVVQTPDSKWDGFGNGKNTNAARVESGGAGSLISKVVQVEKSPRSSSGESSHMG